MYHIAGRTARTKASTALIIVTDTASDILEEEARAMNARLATIDVMFGNVHCARNTAEGFAEFYRTLTSTDIFPTTSQPAPDAYLRIFEEAKAAGEDVLVIGLTSTISGTVESARMAARLSGWQDHIAVMDSKQAIVSQRVVVEQAVRLRDQGLSLAETVAQLESFRDRIHICGILDTLTYLQKGGRIPGPLAAVGNMLKIKPIVAIEDGVLTSPAKARGTAAAKKAIWKRLESVKLDPAWPVMFVYADDRSLAEGFEAETRERLGLGATRIVQIGGVVGAHLGPGCFGFAYVEAE